MTSWDQEPDVASRGTGPSGLPSDPDDAMRILREVEAVRDLFAAEGYDIPPFHQKAGQARYHDLAAPVAIKHYERGDFNIFVRWEPHG